MSASTLNRRRLLQGLAGTSLGLSVGLPVAKSMELPPYDGPLLAVFNATGGWDPTLLVDPKGDPSLNRSYSADQIMQIGALSVAPTAAQIAEGAMSNRSFFERYGAEILVVNGVDVSVNNHSPCSRYIATGELGSLAYPTLPALFAAAQQPEAPLAFLTFGDYSGTGNLIAQTRIPYLSSLDRLGTIGYSDRQRTRRFQHPRVSEQIFAALGEVSERAAPLPKLERARRFVHQAQVSSHALDRLSAFMPAERPDDLYLQQLEIALTGFAAGLSVSANFTMGGFDSHDSNDPDQLRLIPAYLAGVDYFIRRATELGLRDRLFIVMQSEMGRTPWYNESGGKDHWSVTSTMMMGAGVRGGRVVGATQVDPDSGFDQSPARVNPETLALSDEGVRIRPEHLQAAMRAHLGVDAHPLAARFPLKLSPEEMLRGLF